MVLEATKKAHRRTNASEPEEAASVEPTGQSSH